MKPKNPIKEYKDRIEVIDSKTLTLDQIEEKMVELVCNPSNDIVVNMINERKISMLEKIANLKLKRLQLKSLEEAQTVTETKPITVKFISSNTDDQKARLERIDKEIIEQRAIKQDA